MRWAILIIAQENYFRKWLPVKNYSLRHGSHSYSLLVAHLLNYRLHLDSWQTTYKDSAKSAWSYIYFINQMSVCVCVSDSEQYYSPMCVGLSQYMYGSSLCVAMRPALKAPVLHVTGCAGFVDHRTILQFLVCVSGLISTAMRDEAPPTESSLPFTLYTPVLLRWPQCML